MPFEITADLSGAAPVLRLVGELDLSSAPQLERHLQELVTGGATGVVLDVEGLSFLDSSGLGVLLDRVPSGQLRTVALARPQPRVSRVLDVSGAADLLPCFGSVELALMEIAGF